ncbi:MAG: hypothetical protein AUH06_03630 [Gemmatimonadetes bacterium 13_2_20CM_69_27]|nr:MAG: hypothetical protein AUH06_03630 [Gemmatimonadetes bacterium 13_2_20CM_69_27]
MTHATATVDLMRPPFPAEPGSGVYSNKLGMWVFLASDVMFFTALIGTYIILRFGVSQPWAHPNAVLNVPLTAFNTFLLICSSVSMVKAFAAISQGDQRGLKLWLLITILAGASFVSVQVVEYIKLVGHGFTPAGFREGSTLAEHAVSDPVKYGAATAGLYGSTFFTMTIGTYIILRFGVSQPWAHPNAVLNVPLTAFNTFLLICSSVSMVKAFAAISQGDQRGLKLWLLITILAGASFVSVQVVEYIKLVGHGFTPAGFREGSTLAEHAVSDPVKYGAATAGLYGSTFFTMTGFHGFHVTCGVISMTYLYFTKVLPGKYSRQDYRGIETIGLYWHFVDLVWIILFTIVYLI